MPKLEPGGVKKTHAWEHLVRFVFGGVVTACTGLVAHRFGPDVGGLFLAFPAILPASLTLVKQHDGRNRAVEDAQGATLGSIGLAAFAFVTWRTATLWPAVGVLALATAAWISVSVGAWAVRYGRRRSLARARRRRRYRYA